MMGDNGKEDRFRELYLKGDITINSKTLIAAVLIIAVLVAAGAAASSRRKAVNAGRIEAKIDSLLENHGDRLLELATAITDSEPKSGNYNSAAHSAYLDNIKKLDLYLREHFSYEKAGFSAGLILPKETGTFLFVGPGGSNNGETPWHFSYFEPCAEQLLEEGVCKEEKERYQASNHYSFRVLRNPKTSEIAAAFIAAKIERSAFD